MVTAVENKSLSDWIDENQLPASFENECIVSIPDVGKFLVIEPKSLLYEEGINENKIFDREFQIPLSDKENELVDGVDYLLFQFGNKWYYVNDLVPEEIKEFKYLGKANLTFSDVKFPFLGIHSGYELCNGSRVYEDWIKKAKFLGIDTLGICEENTLAGTLPFQEACKKAGIKSIIGETITILTSKKGKMSIKLYVENEEGWKNLLQINRIINVNNGGEFIKEEELFNRYIQTAGLICVLTPDVDLSQYWQQDKFDFYFASVYYQLDFSEWSSNSKDEQWLINIKNYFDNYLLEEGNSLQPILLPDAFYLDKADHSIKKLLNNIGKVGFKNQSKDQYFKSIDELYIQFSQLFKTEDDRWNLIMDIAVDNLNNLCNEIDFKIETGKFRLPEYELSEEQKSKHADVESMFIDLIHEGLEKKIIGKVKNETEYFERLEEEIDVIKRGGFVSYFLTLYDIVQWCHSQDIWVGMGRGSAAGSLVSYLLDIVKIDPIHYKLLFSRFLNAGRLGKSLPDVDLDFEGGKREAVINYIKQKFGSNYVTAIGTYGTFKIKSALKDICREKGVDYSKTNYIASLIDDDKSSFTGLFILASSKPDVKTFVQKNYTIIESIPLCMGQVKNSSIHASGIVVVPKSNNEDIFLQMPIKSIDGNLVSEWEGEWIDKAGFLKFDILGVKQLDKFSEITKLIKQNHGKEITYDDMDLNDHSVFDLFRDGLTEDVFQFGTQGLKAYCKELKPDNVEDLIAAVALYRPGTMDTGMHKKYIKIKHGKDEPIYDEGTKNATKDTFGIAVYQEQVMQITKDVAGFDLVLADDVRKAMGKKDKELLDSYKDKFIQGGLSRGFTEDYLIDLWGKLETFSRYGFNRSHAAAYAIMGYFSQWLKVNFPIEFWTVSLQFAPDDEVINRISEITKISNIEVASVDINKSLISFFADASTNTVYWSLSVKWVGEKALESIIAERDTNGDFYSIEEFVERVSGKSGINKRVINNLILAGAFDKVEKINPDQRGLVIKKYYNFTSQKLGEDFLEMEKWRPYQWVLKQKELTGFGYIDYSKIVKGSDSFATKQKLFKENSEILFAGSEDEENVVVAGILQNLIERKSKKGVFAQLEIIDNTDTLYITLWNDSYEPYKEELKEAKNKIIILSGKTTFDSYKQSNVIHSKQSTKIEII